jgi:hypothetical protein
MLARNGAGPNLWEGGTGKAISTGKCCTFKPTHSKIQAIRAELTGSDNCAALGIVAHSSSPVLALCRKLIDAGHDPARPLEAYRGSTLCLHVRSIGEGASLRVNTAGTGFAPASQPPTASPVRPKAVGHA